MINTRDIEYLKNLLSYEAEQMEEAQVNNDFFEYQCIKKWLIELDNIGRYKKALEKIINLRNEMEYIDEWQEAAAYNQAEEIAEKTLNPGQEPGGLK